MITCERCGTENLDGSRYCDECGAAMWLAGRPGERPRPQGNGSAGQSNKDIPVTVARSAKPSISVASQSAAQVVITDKDARALLVIERGNSAGKQFPLSPHESQIG